MADITDNPEAHRYEIRVDGELAGFAAYRDGPGRRIFTHTEISDRSEGQGLGSQLAKAALDHVRGNELKAVPRCEFIASYLEQHPEYADLVEQP